MNRTRSSITNTTWWWSEPEAGLRATLGMTMEGLKTACITKVFPTAAMRSPLKAVSAPRSTTWARAIIGNSTCTTPSRVGLAR